jgi:hypothetical protein
MVETVQLASSIPPVTPAEAVALEREELTRFIESAAELPPDAWSFPVGSSKRDIHGLVAHVAGGYAAQARFAEFRRQAHPQILRLYRMDGESISETVARVQIGDRAHRSPADLLDELREVGPVAITHRELLFRPFRLVQRALGSARPLPAIPLAPFQAVRDLWYHRLDLTEAAGTGMNVDRDHDGRVLAIMARSSVAEVTRALGERAVDITVRAPDLGRWRFGSPSQPEAVIEIDTITLAKLLGKRRSPAATRERSRIDGEVKTAMVLLTALHG